MKLITELKKPYTEEQRCDFIVEQNHNLGYEIRETETELQAWGLDDEELLEQQKQQVRTVRNSYLEQYIDSKAKNPFMWEDLSDEDKLELGKYRKYLLDYTKEEEWYMENPKTLDEWKSDTINDTDDTIIDTIEEENDVD